MNTDDMTMGQAREIANLMSGSCDASWFKKGQKVRIRTVTHYQTGEVVSVNSQEVVLKDAAWAADTGRFSNALKTGELSEVEPFPDVRGVQAADGAV